MNEKMQKQETLLMQLDLGLHNQTTGSFLMNYPFEIREKLNI